MSGVDGVSGVGKPNPAQQSGKAVEAGKTNSVFEGNKVDNGIKGGVKLGSANPFLNALETQFGAGVRIIGNNLCIDKTSFDKKTSNMSQSVVLSQKLGIGDDDYLIKNDFKNGCYKIDLDKIVKKWNDACKVDPKYVSKEDIINSIQKVWQAFSERTGLEGAKDFWNLDDGERRQATVKELDKKGMYKLDDNWLEDSKFTVTMNGKMGVGDLKRLLNLPNGFIQESTGEKELRAMDQGKGRTLGDIKPKEGSKIVINIDQKNIVGDKIFGYFERQDFKN